MRVKDVRKSIPSIVALAPAAASLLLSALLAALVLSGEDARESAHDVTEPDLQASTCVGSDCTD